MYRSLSNPLLLTPGPVATTARTKQVMLQDRASGGDEFQADIRFARDYLLGLVKGSGQYTAIPLPGSTTYSNEAVIAGLVPQGGKLLIFSNGVYGDRLVEIAAHLGTPHVVLRGPPFRPPVEADFDKAFQADPAITHLFLVHCETSTGVLNPVDAAAAACLRHGKGLFIDAVASFGAIELDTRALRFDALTLSSNKCMESVPGVGWTIIRKQVLESAKGTARSLSLDLWDQGQHMDRTEAFRFTPPTQVVAAFAEACRQHAEEGGTTARLARYNRNWVRLVEGMRQMGFVSVVPDAHASPIVATFYNPDHPNFSFDKLFEGMKRRGFIIFPGRLALANTFRIGCMGAIEEDDIAAAMEAVAECTAEMDIGQFGRTEPIGRR